MIGGYEITKLHLTLLSLLATASAFAQLENTDVAVLTPDVDSTFSRAAGEWSVLLHQTTSNGNYTPFSIKGWFLAGESLAGVTFDLGARTGGIDAAWFANAPTWQSTASGLSGTFSGVLQTSGTRELRWVTLDASSLGYSVGDSALGLSYAGSLTSVIWATADPNQVNPNFVSDGIGGPGGQQTEDFMAVAPVPEPATIAALALGLVGILRHRRRG